MSITYSFCLLDQAIRGPASTALHGNKDVLLINLPFDSPWVMYNVMPIYTLYHGVRLRQRVHTVTISRSAGIHAERLPIEHGPRRTPWVIGGRVMVYT